jgi:predicted metal-dependent phosphoesterase TrpH
MRIDTHIHTSYSNECDPERCTPELVLKAARRAGMDGVCISDHDTVEGYARAKSIARRGDPLIVPGCEVTTSRGHLLVIGVEGSWSKGIDPAEVVDEVREEGGLVTTPHPFYISTISASWLARELGLAVETYNAMASVLVYPNLVARKFAAKYGLPVTGGSDAHSWELVGLGFTETDSGSIDGFISDILEGRSRAMGRRPSLGWTAGFAARAALGSLQRIFTRSP